MSKPANQSAPFANTEDAVRDIGSAVDFILKRRNIDKLNLLGWSWGTTTTALYTTRHNDKIRTLVLYAPVWTPPPGAVGPKPPTDAYRSVNMGDAFKRWVRGVPADKQADLIPPGWFDAWAKAVLESDPEGSKQNPPVVRAPHGVMVDILGQWLQGKAMYDAKKILVPTQLIIGEWDADTPVIMARTLFSQLTHTPYKAYVEIGESTHTLVMEKNRMQLIRAVQAFIEDPAPKE
jgi:pimeloyl-ACP methyl ester carboxylesterase